LPERVEERAPAALQEPAPAEATQVAVPTLQPPSAGNLSPAQLIAMQQGAGNAAVANYLNGRRGESSTFTAPPSNGAAADFAWPPPGLVGRPAAGAAAAGAAGPGATDAGAPSGAAAAVAGPAATNGAAGSGVAGPAAAGPAAAEGGAAAPPAARRA